MPRRPIAALTCAALLALSACGDDAADAPEADALATFADLLAERAGAFDYDGGQWLDDYGDANFYGLAYYTRVGLERQDAAYLQRADEVRDYDRSVLEHANDDLGWYMENLEEVLMSGLGLVEYAAATGDTDALAAVDAFIDVNDRLVAALGDYVDVSVGAFAADTYGPTAITGGFALLNLQYAYYLDTPRTQDRLGRAVEIVAAIDQNAFDGARYQFRPGDETLYLYPNSIMILVLCRLYALTGESAYLERAEGVFEGVAPLRNAELGYYRSPYSAEAEGAETDEYSTLSSQNYFTLALVLLYASTANELYLERAHEVLDFVRLHLYDDVQGRVLHHWIDGHVAHPDDPDYFCSGCNLQYLYVVWYLQSVAGA